MAVHSRTSNLEKGNLPYMAPELILNNLEWACAEDLKSIDVWALGMTFKVFELLNPDLRIQGPELLEHHQCGKDTYALYYKNVIEGKMQGVSQKT